MRWIGVLLIFSLVLSVMAWSDGGRHTGPLVADNSLQNEDIDPTSAFPGPTSAFPGPTSAFPGPTGAFPGPTSGFPGPV